MKRCKNLLSVDVENGMVSDGLQISEKIHDWEFETELTLAGYRSLDYHKRKH